MHEWILAEGIVELLKKKKCKKAKIILGELQGIDEKILMEAIERIWDGEIKIEKEKAVLRCNDCGYEWTPKNTGEKIEEIHFLPELVKIFERCPKCGGKDLTIKRGRGIRVIIE